MINFQKNLSALAGVLLSAGLLPDSLRAQSAASDLNSTDLHGASCEVVRAPASSEIDWNPYNLHFNYPNQDLDSISAWAYFLTCPVGGGIREEQLKSQTLTFNVPLNGEFKPSAEQVAAFAARIEGALAEEKGVTSSYFSWSPAIVARSWEKYGNNLVPNEGSHVHALAAKLQISPEGEVSSGSRSIAPGAVDSARLIANEQLTRQTIGDLVALLNEHGADIDNVSDIESIEIKSSESDFSQSEMNTLVEQADSLINGGMLAVSPDSDNLEKVWRMIVAYKENKIIDANVVRALDRIVADKNHLELNVELVTSTSNVRVFPVPLGAALALYLMARRLFKRQEKSDVPEAASEGHEVDDQQDLELDDSVNSWRTDDVHAAQESREEVNLDMPKFSEEQIAAIVNVQLPDENSAEYRDLAGRCLRDRLILNFAKEQTGYFDLFSQIAGNWSELLALSSRKTVLPEILVAQVIIKKWEDDFLANNSAPDAIINFRQDSDSLKAAKLCARALVRIASEAHDLEIEYSRAAVITKLVEDWSALSEAPQVTA